MKKNTIRGLKTTGFVMPGVINTGLLIAVTGLAGCSSMPRQSTSIPPQQAVIAGYQQLYSTPSYQFSGQFRINALGFNRDPEVLQAVAERKKQQQQKEKQQLIEQYIEEFSAEALSENEQTKEGQSALSASQQQAIRQQAEQEVRKYYDEMDETENAEQDSDADESGLSDNQTATSRLGKLKTDKLIEDLMYTYTKRYQFNYQGTMDMRHGQIALTPEIRYEATNMAGYMRVPLVLDLRQAHLYADLSALSPWLVQVQNDGKYSRFDLSSYKDKVDFKQLFEVIKQTTQASYQLPKREQFKEMGINAQERKQGAVRKVELSQPVAHRIADVLTFLSMNQNSLKQIVKSKNLLTESGTEKPEAQDRNESSTQLMNADAVSQLLAQDPAIHQNISQMVEEKIDPASTLRQVILLDSKGRVIESNTVYHLLFKPSSKGQLNMQLSHQLNFSNYGRAQVAFKPNANNWIDAKANMQDTVFGDLVNMFSKKSRSTDALFKSFGEEEDLAESEDEINAVEADTGDTETDTELLETAVLEALSQLKAGASEEKVFVETFVAMSEYENTDDLNLAERRQKALKVYHAQPAPDFYRPLSDVDAAAQPSLIYQAINAAHQIQKTCAKVKDQHDEEMECVKAFMAARAMD